MKRTSTVFNRAAAALAVWAMAATLVVAGSGRQEAIDAARSYRERQGARILREYSELLAIPNVQADPDGLQRTAESIRDALVRRGAVAELLESDEAPPVIFGRIETPGADRTLGVYVHYDGQPVDPVQWTHPPFEATLLTRGLDEGGRVRPFPEQGEKIDPEWRIYARSSGDDKAPIPAILAALDALAEGNVPLGVNLVFFFEGEEEAGSTHLGDYLRQSRERLDEIDLWLICDGPVHQSRRPQLVFGVRGYSGLDIRVYGANRYLHSGHYGNWAPNPALRLARLLAGMKGPAGDVRIDGFHDSVVPLTAKEHAAIEALPDFDTQLRRELGLAATEGDNAPLIERILRPSLNIRGMQSATVGSTARNIVPPFADASIDIRLVKGNDPDEMLDLVERHIAAQGYLIVREDPDEATRLAHPLIARVTRRPGYPAIRTPMDLPIVQPVIEAANSAAGEDVILMPTLGGSLPLYLFVDVMRKPVVIVPIANHDDNQHAPDENLRVANLWYGIDLFAALFAAK